MALVVLYVQKTRIKDKEEDFNMQRISQV